jgi:RNA polymerase sigma factor for flagellar operon FliA
MKTAPPTTSRRRHTSVVQYTLAGAWVAHYPSARAAGAATGINHGNLSKVANRQCGLRKAGGYVWLWADSDAHLLREYRRTGDTNIRREIVERHVYVVRYQANRLYARLPLSFDMGDLIAPGTFGLMEAVERFEESHNALFSTYCSRRVLGAMLDYLRAIDWTPRLVKSRTRRIEHARDVLRTELGREPAREELAAYLKLSAADMEKLERDSTPRQVTSLSAVVTEGDSGRMVEQVDRIVDHKAVDPADDPNHTALRDLLLSQFSLTKALLIRLYYVDDLRMSEIGRALKLSESRISQMHTEALKSLLGRFGERLHDMLGRAA